jgi:hypothetical protein
MPVILYTQEERIRRLTARSKPGQIVCETLSLRKPSQKRTGGVAQGVGRVQTPVPKTKQNKKKE